MSKAQSSRVYIGIGSNLENPLEQLKAAVSGLRDIPGTQLLTVSNIYQTAPIGPAGQPDYTNAAALLESTLTPEALLDELQKIELDQGRVREVRWGPRTLDLDIILYAGMTIRTARLTVPHVEMENRNFVLVPLMDISPELVLPNGASLKAVSKQAGNEGIKLNMTADEFIKACS
ncbi:MAG: 2-amino-4-hydroxy-6-hydroxymethyldihydropteridine diphosphokinase [Pseudomonadales bacterium]